MNKFFLAIISVGLLTVAGAQEMPVHLRRAVNGTNFSMYYLYQWRTNGGTRPLPAWIGGNRGESFDVQKIMPSGVLGLDWKPERATSSEPIMIALTNFPNARYLIEGQPIQFFAIRVGRMDYTNSEGKNLSLPLYDYGSIPASDAPEAPTDEPESRRIVKGEKYDLTPIYRWLYQLELLRKAHPHLTADDYEKNYKPARDALADVRPMRDWIGEGDRQYTVGQVLSGGVLLVNWKVGDSTGTFALKNHPDHDSVTDGERINFLAFRTGNYQFQTTLGANRTVPLYDCGVVDTSEKTATERQHENHESKPQ